jgi:hypothetical protein
MSRKRRKKSKIALLSDQVAEARRIIDAQQALLEELRVVGAPTHEAEGALRIYASSLMHLLAHEQKTERGDPSEKVRNETQGRAPKSDLVICPALVMPTDASLVLGREGNERRQPTARLALPRRQVERLGQGQESRPRRPNVGWKMKTGGQSHVLHERSKPAETSNQRRTNAGSCRPIIIAGERSGRRNRRRESGPSHIGERSACDGRRRNLRRPLSDIPRVRRGECRRAAHTADHSRSGGLRDRLVLPSEPIGA